MTQQSVAEDLEPWSRRAMVTLREEQEALQLPEARNGAFGARFTVQVTDKTWNAECVPESYNFYSSDVFG